MLNNNNKYVTTKKAAEILDVHPNTLRNWARENKIEFIRTDTGHRRYNITKYLNEKETNGDTNTICYCRVSSSKQQDDLQRQIEFMRSQYPNAEIVKDIGNGLNFKRKGLKTILERAMSGDKLQIVVAHKDRLCRFGFELIEYIIERTGGSVVVLSKNNMSSEQELTTDILSVIRLFRTRLHGLCNYKNEIRKDLSEQRTTENP